MCVCVCVCVCVCPCVHFVVVCLFVCLLFWFLLLLGLVVAFNCLSHSLLLAGRASVQMALK